MNLYLFRHAEAEERAPSGRDQDRALTPKGRDAAGAVAEALSKVAQIEYILSSPFVRARETAEFVARKFPKASLQTSDALTPSALAADVIAEITDREEANILFVGHQPHLGSLLGFLATGNASVEIPMKKASIARLSFADARLAPPGVLKWLLSPKLSERIS